MSLEHTADIKIQQAKEDLAEQYIADFKDELTGLKKMGISLVEKKMKTLLLQDDELTDNLDNYNLTRRQEQLAKLSPTLTDKVINFLKEKQKLLLKVQTQKQLEALKQWIDPATISEDQVNQSGDTQGDNTPQTPMDNNNPSDDIASEESPDNVHIIHPENPMVWVGILGAGAVGWVGQERRAHNRLWSRAEKLTDAISQKELKTSLQEIQKTLEAQTHNPRLLSFQKKNIEKTIKAFQEAEKHSDAVTDLTLRKKLTKTNKVSGVLFGKMSAKEIQILSKSMVTVVSDTTLLEQIAKTSDPAAIKSLLSSKGVKGMTDAMIESLARIDKVDDVTALTRVLSKGSEISSLAKAVRFAPLIDVAALGYDLYNWYGDNQEAESMRNDLRGSIASNRANFHLWASAVGAAAWIYAWLAASWPVGWIALGGVAVAEGAKISADRLYFDVQDFYGQDEVDFSIQSESQIDQAIVDAVAGGGRDHLSLNEEVCEFFGGIDKKKKMETLHDALWAKIFLDEKDDFPLIYEYIQIQAYKANLESYTPEQQQSIYEQTESFKTKQAEYEAERKNLDTIVATRMEYIDHFLPGGEKFARFTQEIKNNKPLATINTIVTQSKTYLEMKADPNTQATTIETYLAEKEKNLQGEDPQLFDQLAQLAQKEPFRYDEIIHHTRAFNAMNEETYRLEHESLFQVADYLLCWDEWYSAKHIHDRPLLTIENDYKGIEQTLTDITQGKALSFVPTGFTQEEIIYGLDTLQATDLAENYTDSLPQNILYRFFHEFHHYNGPNDIASLQQFALDDGGEKRNDTYGIYYNPEDKKWYINNDNTIDQPINLHDLESLSSETLMKQWFHEKPLWFDALTINPLTPLGVLRLQDQLLTGWSIVDSVIPDQKKDVIDGATETTDTNKIDELVNTFGVILTQEKSLHTPENQKKVSDQITSYIKNNAQTENYILLPHHLVAASTRAGLGEMQYWFFSLDAQGKILATTDTTHISLPLRLPNITKQYKNTQWKLQKIDASEEKQTAIEHIDTMTQAINTTMGELQLSERGKISYNPETCTLSSWGSEITCIYNEKKKMWVLGDEFPISYKEMKEAFWMANLVNRIRAYKKEHGDAVFQRWYMGVKDGLYNTATTPDTQILDPDTIDAHYAASFSKKWRETMVDYYNNLPAKVDNNIPATI